MICSHGSEVKWILERSSRGLLEDGRLLPFGDILAGCPLRRAAALEKPWLPGGGRSHPALGIGANTAIFSVVDSVLLKPLPFKDPDRLAIIWETSLKNRAATSPVSSADFIDWKDQTRRFEELAAWRFLYFNLSGTDEPERVQGLTVSASFLPLPGAQSNPPVPGSRGKAARPLSGTGREPPFSNIWRSASAGVARTLGLLCNEIGLGCAGAL